MESSPSLLRLVPFSYAKLAEKQTLGILLSLSALQDLKFSNRCLKRLIWGSHPARWDVEMALISRATVLIIDSLLEPTGSFPWKSVRDQTLPPPPPDLLPFADRLDGHHQSKKGKRGACLVSTGFGVLN